MFVSVLGGASSGCVSAAARPPCALEAVCHSDSRVATVFWVGLTWGCSRPPPPASRESTLGYTAREHRPELAFVSSAGVQGN